MHFPFSVAELTQKYGSPLYVYDADKMKSQFDRLNQAFSYPKFKICYACKALNNLSVLTWFKNIGAGLDAVSIQEVHMGIKAGFNPQEILFTPNMVSWEEMQEAIKLGVHINVDHIELLEQIAEFHPGTPVCIRINPHIAAGGHKNISVGHIDSKFGISIHQMPLVERLVKTLNIPVEGLHMHTGSDILESDVFLLGADILLSMAERFSETLSYLDFGSGFKVKYKDQDIETDMEELGQKLMKKIIQFNQKIGKEITVIFEPGKFLVSESGYFITKVNTVKQTTSTVFVGVNSGFNHLIRPMFYDAYHEIINATNPQGREKIYTVVGNICETDTFGWNRKLNEVRVGDLLVIKNAGAYCFTMSSNYNGRNKPAEVLIHQGHDYLIRESEIIEDQYVKQKLIELKM